MLKRFAAATLGPAAHRDFLEETLAFGAGIVLLLFTVFQ